jgi:hypothetical protein
MVDGTRRIAGNLGNLSILNINNNATPSMAHPTMALDNGVVAINFHFLFYVGVDKFSHFVLLSHHAEAPPFLA